MRILLQTGGYAGHPVAEQADLIAELLGSRAECVQIAGNAAFDALDGFDLLVPMGTIWTDLPEGYTPLTERQKQAIETWVTGGKPLLLHHGAVASYDDWPRYDELLGIRWIWGRSTHAPYGRIAVEVLPTGHPTVAGLSDFELDDEIYYDLVPSPAARWQCHAQAAWQGRPHPMLLTSESGRIPGAGQAAWIALGHDLRSFESESLRRMWVQAVEWCVGA